MTTPAHDPASPESQNGPSAAQADPADADTTPATEPEAADQSEDTEPETEAGPGDLEAAQPEPPLTESATSEPEVEPVAAESEAELEPAAEAVEPVVVGPESVESAVAVQPEPSVAEPEVEPEAADSEPELEAATAVEPTEQVAEPAPEAGEPEDQPDEVLVSSGLPDLTEDEALRSALEALLLVVDSPAEVELLADALGEPVKRIRQALKTMAATYAEQNRGIDLRDVGGGWRFYTRDKYAPFVEKLLLDGQRAKLTRAALESLAVIAYRQPVTRARVAAVRGVNVDGVIRTLLARGLIEETGTDKDTGGILYRTTELFLERLGLSSLEDLPPIAPLLPEVDAIDDV